MKTVPLRGKKAAGRVALVDDEDYDLVMQHKWRVYGQPATPTRRAVGPYAVTTIREDGRRRSVPLHRFLTGWPLTDHENHDGLDNRRSNLRPATKRQNGQNSRPRIAAASRLKGVSWHPQQGVWAARIVVNGRSRRLCASPSELECAYAYDAAARELFGEFACTNFPEGPTRAMSDQWQAERLQREAAAAAKAAAHIPLLYEGRDAFWAQREAETRTCQFCGSEYQTRAVGISRYCTPRCQLAAWRQRQREQRDEGGPALTTTSS